MNSEDPFDLNRFIQAQDSVYERVRGELLQGKKRSHWMWFIFPQIDGLGFSQTARRYSIKSLEEAETYLCDPLLGDRLLECADLVLGIKGKSATDIFGFPDHMKLRSSMTLFSLVSEPRNKFLEVLEKYFNGRLDEKTLKILGLV